MSLYEYFDSHVRRFGIVDTKLALGAAMSLALLIAKLVPDILTINIWWFVALWIGCGVRPMLVFFGNDSRASRSTNGGITALRHRPA